LAVAAMVPITAIWPGRPDPLGATWDGHGVNFALFSAHAEGVELCLFDKPARREVQRIAVREQTRGIWHCYLPEARPGLVYGYRVHGPYRPQEGHRFNANKLLLDPYAAQIVGQLRWVDAMFGYSLGSKRADLSFDRHDNAVAAPKCRVVDRSFTWGEDRRPQVPWNETIIYELHVRGYTMRHPEVSEPLRGTYAGLACASVIDHLKRLGVTSIELLPVHQFVDDRRLVDMGLRNYWGYNSIGFFAPHAAYSASGSIQEFKSMVRALHAAGLEVILDVVYNHSAEGNHLGPTLCFRGIDNASYYRLTDNERRYYVDYTGTGNTLDVRQPCVLQLIMDSLRYWVTEMRVDGFRFDLASSLAREDHAVDRRSGFFDVMQQDPVLSQVKLIAEPWDLGEGGYQVGSFPPGWAEWNDKYRDTVRAFWKGDPGRVGELARRVTGSSDLYAAAGRSPQASINFVTAHDGFTLHDLVSYNDKHNEANGEQNRDGNDHNLSWNSGVEGPTDDPAVNALRTRQTRNFLATLLLSEGVPMLLAGDEFGRTQNGNNNAYCQDNDTSWVDWTLAAGKADLIDFVRELIVLRREHPVFRRRRFFRGEKVEGSATKDIVWLRPDGQEMTDQEWNDGVLRHLGMYLAGDALGERGARGRALADRSFVLLFNANYDSIGFRLPALATPAWQVLLDTARDDHSLPVVEPEHEYPLQGRSLVVLAAGSG
jgi:isoamylase